MALKWTLIVGKLKTALEEILNINLHYEKAPGDTSVFLSFARSKKLNNQWCFQSLNPHFQET